MHGRSILLLAGLCACSSAPPSSSGSGVSSCDVLPLLGQAVPTALASDGAGGIALAGTSAGAKLRSGLAVMDGQGGFVLRASADGEVGWIRGIGAARPLAAAIAPDGGVVVVGQAQRQCFAARLSADGREVWTSRLTGDGQSACRAVALDSKSGDLWAVGEFTGSIGPVPSQGLTDAMVLKISGATGEMRLVRTFGSPGTDTATSVAVTPSGDAIVGGSFGADVDASVSAVDFGLGTVRGAGGADGYVVALSSEGGTRWAAVVGEQGEDEVVGVAARGASVYAAANVHRERQGAQCGGHVLILRQREWVRVLEDPCASARAAAFDGTGRFWALENIGRALRALAFAPRDGELLGSRTWGGDRATVRGAAMTQVPGGFAIAALTDGESMACGKPVGTGGEQSAFVVWVRDLSP
jgi:hypothetical protein